jgi:LysM repeat protein
MNNSNPLIPQGSLLEQQTKGRARFKVAVFCVVALHVLFFTGLLMVGCSRDTSSTNPENATPPASTTDTNAPEAQTNLPVPVPSPGSNAAAETVVPPAPATNTYVTPPQPPAPGAAGGTTEYVVTKGDSYYTIGKKFGVSMKAIQTANPDVNPNKMKVGQKIQIPASTANTGSSAAGASATTDSGAGESVYTVKTGDSLTKIAKDHGTTIKAIRSANNMKTDKIKAGDKLKLPVKAPASTTPPVDTTPAPTTSSVPALPAPGAAR